MGAGRKAEAYSKATGKRHKFNRLKRDDLLGILEAVGITILVAFLFFRAFYGLFAGLIIIPFWMKQYRDAQKSKYEERLKGEFKEYMLLISNGLQAGYSLEKAFLQAEEELFKLFGKESVLIKLVHEMNQKIKMNIQLEKAFLEMAKKTELEDALNLADILSFSKRAGGDYGKQIRECAIKIEEKLAVSQEITTMITEKQLELKVMSVMPMGILSYIALTSADFIAPLYKNAIGIVVMSACLIMYGGMIVLGKKIVAIKV